MLAVLLGMHLAMLPQGKWFDEYFTFSFLRVWGWAGVWHRLAHWGMRPVSEVLAYGYCRLVLWARAPLIWECLAVCWLILLACVAAALSPWRTAARAPRWLLLLALPLLFLVSAPVGELWYWPLGALAYLPALGAAAYGALAIAGPGLRRDRDWALLSALLTAGALSAELGTFVALLLAPLLFADLSLRRQTHDVRHALTISVPILAAGFVMASLMHGRAANPSEMVIAGGSFHHALPSLRAAMPHLLAGLAGWGDSRWDTARHVASRICLFAASTFVIGAIWPAPVARGRIMLLLAAFAGAALLSIAGAFYQFGLLCCERHESFRQALYVLMVVASAGLMPRPLPGRFRAVPVETGAVLLILSVLAVVPPRISALLAEYRLADVQRRAQSVLFASGEDKHTDTLTMIVAPPGPLLQSYPVTPGTYSMSPPPIWYVQAPMLFFGKTHLDARAP